MNRIDPSCVDAPDSMDARGGMRVPANFREFADQCGRLAENTDNSDERIVLLRMAHAWRDLASDEERLEQLIREADETFASDGEGGFARRLALAADFAARRTH